MATTTTIKTVMIADDENPQTMQLFCAQLQTNTAGLMEDAITFPLCAKP